MLSSLPSAPPSPSRRARLGLLAISLALSLGLAELGARLVHRGAYPYLNLFVADARHGVRLQPDAATRVRSRTGRLTDLATNSLGFRGGEWEGTGGVLLLGDSQVFGFGVAQDETFGAVLARRLGVPVRNAAVPSWGPAEYVAALAELGPRWRPRHVVFVANAANDWFETGGSNARRTTARDGWAVRWQPDLAEARPFPGRAWLLGRSHLVLAARELWQHAARAAGPPPADAARDLLREAASLRRPRDGHRSTITPYLLEAARICERLGCTVVAVALPLDLQVDAREWRKYRAAPADLDATLPLLDDLCADARDAGLPAVNLFSALRAASPGAFLPDDYHLSAAGHRAVAEALLEVLR